MSINELQSVVIVRNKKGAVATIRFEDERYDKMFSSPNKNSLYGTIDRYISTVLKR